MSHDLVFDRAYDRETHLWVKLDGTTARVGFDPLGRETSGDIVALSFFEIGTALARGEAFGSIEAAKFVGPLSAPVAGTIQAHNEELLSDPGRVADAPFEHWLVEFTLTDTADTLANLLTDPAEIRAWFDDEQQRFRDQGMIAE